MMGTATGALSVGSMGWRVGDVKDFLGLTDPDMAVIDMRVSLATELRQRRLVRNVSQATLARRIGSSQSRVAKMEAGDPSVPLDLLIRCLLIFGVTTRAIAATIAQTPKRKVTV
jgi:DNA-binding XRE family transcriptional regulator